MKYDWEHIANVKPYPYLLNYFSQKELQEKGIDKDISLLSERGKKILKTVCRFGFISEKLELYSKGRDSMQILFMIMILESVGKIIYEKEVLGSKEIIKKVFKEFISDDDREILSTSFKYGKKTAFKSFDEVIDLFYKIRCEFAHELEYLNFSLMNENSSTPTSMKGSNVISHIKLSKFRKIIYNTCIKAAVKMEDK